MASKSLDDIQAMLDALPMKEFRFDKVREDALTYVGALRTTKGQNVIEPSHESASMVVGLKASIDFLTEAPVIVQQLLDTIKINESQATTKAPLPPDEDNRPPKPPAPPKDREVA